MAWFDEFNLPGFTVEGKFAWIREDGPDENDYPDVQVASGTVLLTPTAKSVRVDGAWIGIRSVQATIFDGEIVVSEEDPRPVRLLSTDADTGVEGWGWEATVRIEGASIRKTVPFLGPADSTVSLTGTDLIPITGNPVEVITATGPEGPSAYEVAVAQGFEGTEEEWLESLRGPKGGDSTVPGPANTLSIGTVTTGAAGSNAAASITGTAPNQTLGFTIPRGLQGTQGPQGLRGPTGSVKIDQPAPGVWDFPTQALDVQVADVQGLAARLAALEYDSGWRNITSLMAVQPTSGSLYLCRDGNRIWVHAAALRFAASASFVTLTGLLPTGFRPKRIIDVAMGTRVAAQVGGAFRVNPDGTSYFYAVKADQQIDGLADFPTSDPIPTTPPGDPA